MKRAYRSLIFVPQIRIVIAHKGFSVKCPRCKRKITEGEDYIEHSTDGRIHFRCLRVGQAKEFIGRGICRR